MAQNKLELETLAGKWGGKPVFALKTSAKPGNLGGFFFFFFLDSCVAYKRRELKYRNHPKWAISHRKLLIKDYTFCMNISQK